MSKRHDVERQLHSLGEIREIMNAMKNLALMETRKLSRVLATQQRVVESIREAADDFIEFHPQFFVAEPGAPHDVLMLIGSERGFCGDFNEALLRAVDLQAETLRDPALVVFGSKLSAKLLDDRRVAARLEAPSTLEEIPAVLLQLMEALNRWQTAQKPARPRLSVLYHRSESSGVVVDRLDPFPGGERGRRSRGYRALLNLEPRAFVALLTEHYLFAALHGIFYSSLMAENQRRMQHMNFAVHRIEQHSAELLRKRNGMRQEEITEEIEIIMLNAETLSDERARGRLETFAPAGRRGLS